MIFKKYNILLYKIKTNTLKYTLSHIYDNKKLYVDKI